MTKQMKYLRTFYILVAPFPIYLFYAAYKYVFTGIESDPSRSAVAVGSCLILGVVSGIIESVIRNHD